MDGGCGYECDALQPGGWMEGVGMSVMPYNLVGGWRVWV